MMRTAGFCSTLSGISCNPNECGDEVDRIKLLAQRPGLRPTEAMLKTRFVNIELKYRRKVCMK